VVVSIARSANIIFFIIVEFSWFNICFLFSAAK